MTAGRREAPETLAFILSTAMREARAGAGVSLRDMALRLDISKSFLSEIERGVKPPPRRVVLLYDVHLGCNSELMGLLDDYHYVRAQDAAGPPEDRPDVPPVAAIPGDMTEFLRDLTPDGPVLEEGEPYTKTWLLRNSGAVPWQGRFLERIGRVSGPEVPRSARLTPIPDTDPGCEVAVSVVIYGARLAGTRTLRFKMTDGTGHLFFPSDQHTYGVLVDIVSTGREGAYRRS